ncbi:unnamed protein product, partial [Mesorhabditis spiculigera]
MAISNGSSEYPFMNEPPKIKPHGLVSYFLGGNRPLDEVTHRSPENGLDRNLKSVFDRKPNQKLWDGIYYWVNDGSVNIKEFTPISPKAQRAMRAAARFWDSVMCIPFQEVSGSEALKNVEWWRGDHGHEHHHPGHHFLFSQHLPVREAAHATIGWLHTVDADLHLPPNLMHLGDEASPMTVIHEFGHTLGMLHMQMRGDRDEYIHVDFAAIDIAHYHLPNEKNANFNHKWTQDRYAEFPYEFGSTMHYSAAAFAKHGAETMNPLPKFEVYHDTMGHGLPTLYDIMSVHRHYGCHTVCPEKYAPDQLPKCENGGINNPRNCRGDCICPVGFAPPLCKMAVTQCGRAIEVDHHRRSFQLAYPKFRDIFDDERASGGSIYIRHEERRTCTYFLRAPPGSRIKVTIEGLEFHKFRDDCGRGCRNCGLEFKLISDHRYTGATFCQKSNVGRELVSEGHILPIIVYNTIGGVIGRIAYELTNDPPTLTMADLPGSTPTYSHQEEAPTLRELDPYHPINYKDPIDEQSWPELRETYLNTGNYNSPLATLIFCAMFIYQLL